MKSKATRIVDAMMEKDHFSQWLGIVRLEEREGYCRLQMTVRVSDAATIQRIASELSKARGHFGTLFV